ncbi:MAG: nuclear transport factor 2 family protein [Alphaproteobacteria bacterium]|nr:nuclear transport factor 2 family protein [Alphaproteobacteria bacterium]
MDLRSAADRYVAVMQSISPQTLSRLAEVCAPDILFKDPFNEGRGLDYVIRIFEQMYRDIGETKTVIDDVAFSDTACYLRWTLSFRRKNGREATVLGMSEVHFGADGRAIRHFDHWDAASQVYELVPVLGAVLRRIKRRLATPLQ